MFAFPSQLAVEISRRGRPPRVMVTFDADIAVSVPVSRLFPDVVRAALSRTATPLFGWKTGRPARYRTRLLPSTFSLLTPALVSFLLFLPRLSARVVAEAPVLDILSACLFTGDDPLDDV